MLYNLNVEAGHLLIDSYRAKPIHTLGRCSVARGSSSLRTCVSMFLASFTTLQRTSLGAWKCAVKSARPLDLTSWALQAKPPPSPTQLRPKQTHQHTTNHQLHPLTNHTSEINPFSPTMPHYKPTDSSITNLNNLRPSQPLILPFDDRFLRYAGHASIFMNPSQTVAWIDSVSSPYLQAWYESCLSRPHNVLI